MDFLSTSWWRMTLSRDPFWKISFYQDFLFVITHQKLSLSFFLFCWMLLSLQLNLKHYCDTVAFPRSSSFHSVIAWGSVISLAGDFFSCHYPSGKVWHGYKSLEGENLNLYFFNKIKENADILWERKALQLNVTLHSSFASTTAFDTRLIGWNFSFITLWIVWHEVELLKIINRIYNRFQN